LEQVIELATGLGINDNPDDRLEEDDLTIDQKDRVRRSMEELVKNIPARKDLDIAVHLEPASLTPLVTPWHCFRVFCPPPVRRPWGALPHRLAHSLARSLADAWTVNKTVPKKGSTFVCFSPVSQALDGVLFPR